MQEPQHPPIAAGSKQESAEIADEDIGRRGNPAALGEKREGLEAESGEGREPAEKSGKEKDADRERKPPCAGPGPEGPGQETPQKIHGQGPRRKFSGDRALNAGGQKEPQRSPGATASKDQKDVPHY